jgi:hypothetical protein
MIVKIRDGFTLIKECEEGILIRCDKHKCDFATTYNRHKHSKYGGCTQCRHGGILESRAKKGYEFLEEARRLWCDKYSYFDVPTYCTSKTQIGIVCRKHGEFYQTVNSHLSGRGCRACGYESKKGKGIGGYSYQLFEEYPERAKEQGLFYLCEMFNDEYHFLKYGITKTTLGKRFSVHRTFFYEPIIVVRDNLFNLFELEQQFRGIFPQHNCKSHIDGYTETIPISFKREVIKHMRDKSIALTTLEQ